MAATGGCSAQTTTTSVTITTQPSATISYTGSPYCSGTGTASVTSSGTTGGSYSSASGLVINSSTGSVNLATSTAGTYTVTYTVSAAGGCSLYTTTNNITITPKVSSLSFAAGSSSTRCQGAGTVTYSAIANNTTGISYSLDATSLAAGNTINSSTGAVTFVSGWSGSSTITALAGGCTPLTAVHTATTSATPSVSASTTFSCVGGNTGSITATGSVGASPYTYNLNGGTYQSSGSFTGLTPATYTIYVKSNDGCVGSSSVVVSDYPNSTDNQSTAGTDSWIGHIYDGTNFNNYKGQFTEPESFSEDFGGDGTCFGYTSTSGNGSIYTETFSVAFQMNSTRKGLYVVDLGSDDGSRLTVDGNLIFNNWSDQAFSSRPRVLMNLTGNSSLDYEFYENGGANKAVFQNLTLVLANSLSTNTTQSICYGSTGSAISGDAFGTLPSGISLSGTGYQWTYSATPGGTRSNISGATGATFTPNTSTAPFNTPGTYYVYRNAMVSSNNNTGESPYVATNVSNVATITINPVPSATISYANTPFCNSSSSTESVTLTGTTGGVFSATGLSINSSTGDIVPSSNPVGLYTINYSIAASGGCSSFSTSTKVYIGTPGTWSGHVNTDWNNSANWICGVIPSSSTDATIPKTVSNYPTVITNTAEAKDLNIKSGASLVITGSIKIAGSINNSGNFNVSNGTLEMNGSGAQSIAGSMFENKTIKNLVVSNTGSGLSVSSTANDTLKITGQLSFGNASSILNTGDNITLVSNYYGTASVGIVGSSNAINGKVIVERYINTGTGAGQHGKSWQFLSVPTTGQTVKQSWMEDGNTTANYGTMISGAGGTAAGFDLYTAAPSMKYYNYLTNSLVGISNTNNPISDTRGYFVFVRGDRTVTASSQPATTTVLRTKGTLFTGALPSINVMPNNYQSIGNPYASPIDFTLITKDANVDNEFYVWDPYLYGTYGVGGYQTISSVNGWVPVPGGTSAYPSGIANSLIQSGQAFFVHSTVTGPIVPPTPTVSFTEDCKAVGSASANVARVAGGSSVNNNSYLRASLFTGPGQNDIIADGNSVVFSRSFSNGVDGNDALKILNSGENFGVKRAGKILSIEAKAPVTSADTIFYNMSNLAKRTYQLRFAPQNMESTGLQAFLIDNFLNTETPVSLTDSSFINITVTSNAASAAAGRFELVFRQMAALPVTVKSVTAVHKNSDNIVEWNVENENGIQQYEVEKSTDGNHFSQMAVVNAKNSGTGNYIATDRDVTAGTYYYRIKIVSVDGKISYTQTVKVISSKQNGLDFSFP